MAAGSIVASSRARATLSSFRSWLLLSSQPAEGQRSFPFYVCDADTKDVTGGSAAELGIEPRATQWGRHRLMGGGAGGAPGAVGLATGRACCASAGCGADRTVPVHMTSLMQRMLGREHVSEKCTERQLPGPNAMEPASREWPEAPRTTWTWQALAPLKPSGRLTGRSGGTGYKLIF